MSDEKRQWVHGLWASVADSWIERADYLEERGALVTKVILERAAIFPTDRVLAVADGTGGLGIAAAALAASVVTSDVVPAMVDAAAQRTRALGLTNVEARVIDIESIDAASDSFDAVVSREGLMFAVDQQQAFDEVARVLRPGGRLAAAVWGRPDDNPWLSLVMAGVTEAVGHPVPPPGMPGPFALSDKERVLELAATAGLGDPAIDEIDVPFCAPSVDAWIAHTTALAGPIANIVNGFDDAARDAFVDRLRREAEPYVTTSGIEIPGVSLVISATKLR